MEKGVGETQEKRKAQVWILFCLIVQKDFSIVDQQVSKNQNLQRPRKPGKQEERNDTMLREKTSRNEWDGRSNSTTP